MITKDQHRSILEKNEVLEAIRNRLNKLENEGYVFTSPEMIKISVEFDVVHTSLMKIEQGM